MRKKESIRNTNRVYLFPFFREEWHFPFTMRFSVFPAGDFCDSCGSPQQWEFVQERCFEADYLGILGSYLEHLFGFVLLNHSFSL